MSALVDSINQSPTHSFFHLESCFNTCVAFLQSSLETLLKGSDSKYMLVYLSVYLFARCPSRWQSVSVQHTETDNQACATDLSFFKMP